MLRTGKYKQRKRRCVSDTEAEERTEHRGVSRQSIGSPVEPLEPDRPPGGSKRREASRALRVSGSCVWNRSGEYVQSQRVAVACLPHLFIVEY
ncbi:hypothetical protein EYF80_013379 [Liparis tanakae]|uniref:Uncharacterized protein n=1 Tax=Liparis tanakae TaxID=230148 RepID=A0A4Z2IGG5_9TELE|nr:hypothetical protein EYF80_013379 [Liparis tanakae]